MIELKQLFNNKILYNFGREIIFHPALRCWERWQTMDRWKGKMAQAYLGTSFSSEENTDY